MSQTAIVTVYSCGIQVGTISIDIIEIPCDNCKDDNSGCYFYYSWISGNDRMRCDNCGSMMPAFKEKLSQSRSARDPGGFGLVGRIDELIRAISLSCSRCNEMFHGIVSAGWLSKKDYLYRHSLVIGEEPEICPASESHRRLNLLLGELRKVKP
jgi:hypothetical protein